MTGQAYERVLTQLAESCEFVMRDAGLGVRVRIKSIGIMVLVDWLDKHISSQDLNLLDC